MPENTAEGAAEKSVEQPHKAALQRRMSRVVGQVQGISRMIEEDRYCVDILVQISAVRSALNRVGLQIFEDHTRGCVSRAVQAGDGEDAIAELVHILGKFSK